MNAAPYPSTKNTILFDLLLLFAYLFPRDRNPDGTIDCPVTLNPINKHNYFVTVTGHWFSKNSMEDWVVENHHDTNPVTKNQLKTQELFMLSSALLRRVRPAAPVRPTPVTIEMVVYPISQGVGTVLMMLPLLLLLPLSGWNIVGAAAISAMANTIFSTAAAILSPLAPIFLSASFAALLAQIAIAILVVTAAMLAINAAIQLTSICIAAAYCYVKNTWQNFRYKQKQLLYDQEMERINVDVKRENKLLENTTKFSFLSPLTCVLADYSNAIPPKEAAEPVLSPHTPPSTPSAPPPDQSTQTGLLRTFSSSNTAHEGVPPPDPNSARTELQDKKLEKQEQSGLKYFEEKKPADTQLREKNTNKTNIGKGVRPVQLHICTLYYNYY